MDGVWSFFSNSKSSTRSVYAPLFGTCCALSTARSFTSETANPGGSAKHFWVEAKIMSQPISVGRVLSPAMAETLSMA